MPLDLLNVALTFVVQTQTLQDLLSDNGACLPQNKAKPS